MARTLDLDAAIREQIDPDGIVMPFRGQEFRLPAELPLDVFDPFLSEDFDLVGLIRDFLDAEKKRKAGASDSDLGDVIVEVLMDRPNLPVQVRDAFYDALRAIFNETTHDGVIDHFARFQSLKPGLTTYTILVKRLLDLYGVSLGEAFTSPASTENAGATSKPTSPATTPKRTPAKRSGGQGNAKGSSASGDSATS